jgi:hypothetical protein
MGGKVGQVASMTRSSHRVIVGIGKDQIKASASHGRLQELPTEGKLGIRYAGLE